MSPDTPDTPDATRGYDPATYAAVASWSGSDRMSELEATMWRSERHPRQSSTMTTLFLLDRAPDWDRFVEAHDWATSLVARARQRVVEPLLPTAPPVWRTDPHFALSYHLRRAQLGERNTMADLLELTQTIALTPFDRTRPLWEATLVEGLEGGRAAYVLKLHHSVTDGLGTIQLVSMLGSRSRAHTADKPRGVAPTPVEESSDPVAVTVEGLAHTLGRTSDLLLGAVDLGAQALVDPRGAMSETLRFGASLRRVLSPPPATPSPLLRPRDARTWILRTLSCELADLRAAGRVAGGSVNDAFLAALLGGLRRYHEVHGVELDELPVTVPVSLRRADDPMGGNRFAGAMFAAPMGIADPLDRIAAMRGVILGQLTEPALDSLSVITPIANRLPSAVGAAMARLSAATDLSASNMPGLTEDVYLAGAKIERVYPFGPLPGVAIMAVLLTHVGRCGIGLTIDGSALDDVDVLMTCMQEGLDEVLAVGRPRRRGTPRR